MKITSKQFRQLFDRFEKSSPDLSGLLLTHLIAKWQYMSEGSFNSILNGFDDISTYLQMLELYEFDKHFDTEVFLKELSYLMCEFEDSFSEIMSYLSWIFQMLRKFQVTQN